MQSEIQSLSKPDGIIALFDKNTKGNNHILLIGALAINSSLNPIMSPASMFTNSVLKQNQSERHLVFLDTELKEREERQKYEKFDNCFT